MIINNAMKNLMRNKVRTILTGAVAMIIILASACSMVVHMSAQELTKKQMQKIGAQVIITRNDEKLMNSQLDNYREISLKQMKSFTTSSLIQASQIYVSTAANANIKTIEGSGVSSGQVVQSGGMEAENIGSDTTDYSSANLLLIGSTNEKINDDFIKGLRKIKIGKMYAKAGEILIGEELAKKNNLKVGDTFDVKLVDLTGTPTLKLRISGIFEDLKPSGDGDIGSLNKNNELFMSYETFESIQGVQSLLTGMSIEGSFTLKNPDDVKTLEKEFHSKGMPEYFELSVNRHAYDKSVAPIAQVAQITQIFSYVVLGVGAFILVGLSLLIMRERKYEIGVLRAMGVTKKKICIMLCIEMCVITLICGVIALMIAKIAAQPLADLMLAKTNIAESIQFGAFFIGDGMGEGVTSIPSGLSLESVMMVLVVSIGLGLIGSLCGILYVTRNEPMRILAERN